ncbi:MAG: 3-phosphoserine/phosphohydroxythreonine transaminase [Magnetococcus sp. WYHC-3]
MTSVRNFYAGPCALPRQVKQRIQAELLDYHGLGLSIMEISHRAAPVVELIEQTARAFKRVAGLDDAYEVLFLQGGGSLQFSMIPLNFSHPGDPVDYVESGIWAARASAEARKLGRDVHVAASSAPEHQRYPGDWQVRGAARYVHLCTNNTIVGTQLHHVPDVPMPLVGDFSSDILGRQFDHNRFALLYAHAQKSFGASGVTIVALRRDWLSEVVPGAVLPTMLDYRTHVQARSNYNTPPVFSIYVVGKVLEWIEHDMGGLAGMDRLNRAKAQRLYRLIDASGFYHNPVELASRSLMNVIFRLPTVELERRFLDRADAHGLVGLAGHRQWGGCRASLYNGVSLEDVEVLAAFMEAFAHEHGKNHPATLW